MGKTKIKTIDDSQPQAEEKPKRKKVLGANIERDQKLKKAKEKVKSEDVSSRADQSLSEPGEDGQRAQALTSTTPSEPILSISKEASLTGKRSDIKPKQEKKPSPKPKKVRSKKYQEAKEKVDPTKLYPLDEATDLVKQVSYSKFDGSLEIHINTSVKNVRGLISLPFASGKKLKIAAFPSTPFDSAQDKSLRTDEGVIIGDDELLEEISQGKVNFDVLVTTPEWMPKLAKVAKVLGPKGLMPNPKNGTITQDLTKTVEELQSGKTEYKTESKANIIHLGIGKITQPSQELSQNIKVLLSSIGKTKIKKATLSPTMGPGIKLDLSSV